MVGMRRQGHKTYTRKELAKFHADFLSEIRLLSKIRHPCITTVMGAVIQKRGTTGPLLIMEFMEFGSLHDLLHNESMPFEIEVMIPVLRDVSQGMRFLHSAETPIIHADLKSANVLVDSNFRGKVADFGLSQKQKMGSVGTPFFMAPELLRAETVPTMASDAYAFGVLLSEVFSRRDPFEGEDFWAVLDAVANKELPVPKRPAIPEGTPVLFTELMTECWYADPDSRPTFGEIDRRIRTLNVNCAIPSLLAEGRRHKQSSEEASQVLLDVFPKHVADALMKGQKVAPEHKKCVSVFFSDVVGFTNISSNIASEKVSDMLDRLYFSFDKIATKHSVRKIETIGDAYIAVANLTQTEESHAYNLAMFAIEAIESCKTIMIDPASPPSPPTW
jgi:guanylate cyclase